MITKYKSIDELSNFEFHDAAIMKINFNKQQLIFVVSDINVTTKNSQSNFEKDMCVKNANIIFENANVESIIFSEHERYDSDHNLIGKVDAIDVKPEKYTNILKETDGEYGRIFGMEELSQSSNGNYKACFYIKGYHVGIFYIKLTFSKVIIEWDEFNGEAWYEDKKWKKDKKIENKKFL